MDGLDKRSFGFSVAFYSALWLTLILWQVGDHLVIGAPFDFGLAVRASVLWVAVVAATAVFHLVGRR